MAKPQQKHSNKRIEERETVFPLLIKLEMVKSRNMQNWSQPSSFKTNKLYS